MLPTRAGWPARTTTIAVAVALMCCVFAHIGAAQSEDAAYKVSALDRLSLDVAQWDATTRNMEPMGFLSGIYEVDADGTVLLPVVGRQDAVGEPLSDLSQTIETRLRERLGITDGLFVAIRVDTFAPVFIVGAVEKPGSFAFRPGLSVLQATALAGGVRRARSIFSRTDRDVVNALGEYRLLEVDRDRHIARVARLRAELSGDGPIEPPEELRESPLADELLAVETAILDARRDDYQDALTAIRDLKTLVSARIAKLEAEAVLRSQLLESARKQAEAVRTLVNQGLANNARQFSVERIYGESQARILELETARLSAEQRLAEAKRDEANLIGERRVALVSELQQARTALLRTRVRLESVSALYAEAARFGTTLTDLSAASNTRAPTYTVTRQSPDGAARTFVAHAATQVLPGDVLEVRAPDIEGQQNPLIGLDVVDIGSPEGAPSN